MNQKQKVIQFDRLMSTARTFAQIYLRDAIEFSEKAKLKPYSDYLSDQARCQAAKSQIYVETYQASGNVCCICDVCRKWEHGQKDQIA